jgi:hypothetical protein
MGKVRLLLGTDVVMMYASRILRPAYQEVS